MLTRLPTPIAPIAPTVAAPEAWTVVRVIRARLEIAKRIRADMAQLAASDCSLDDGVREWAGRIAVFEARLERAATSARGQAEGADALARRLGSGTSDYVRSIAARAVEVEFGVRR